jgi:hypothetical protein
MYPPQFGTSEHYILCIGMLLNQLCNVFMCLQAVNMDVSLPEDLQMQLETLQAECKQMADSLLQEQTRNKYLQNEVRC